MDKKAERKALAEVFGPSVAEKATDHESPDFLVPLPTEGILGVEVTSVFAGRGAAKLSHMPDYSLGLIDGTHRMHRADHGEFSVDDVTIQQKDGGHVATVRAIIIDQPAPKERWEVFWAKVRDKEAKAGSYLNHCDYLDLVVSDPGNLYFHIEPEEFQRPFVTFVPKRGVLDSPFREIHLITSAGSGQGKVIVPLRANIFAGDCMAFEKLLKPEFEAGRAWKEIFLLLAGALYLEGHLDLRVKIEDGRWGLLAASYEMHYAPDEHALRDWTIPHAVYPGVPAQEMLADLGPLENEARELVARRKELLAMVHIAFPVERGR